MACERGDEWACSTGCVSCLADAITTERRLVEMEEDMARKGQLEPGSRSGARRGDIADLLFRLVLFRELASDVPLPGTRLLT